MLSTLDRAYARFEVATDVKAGETYVIYKTERPIQHPRTKELFGYQSTVLGAAKVVAVDAKAATSSSRRPSSPSSAARCSARGRRSSSARSIAAPNRKAVEGTIIGGAGRRRHAVGEHHVVFVDRGREGRRRGGERLHGRPFGRPVRPLAVRPTWDASFPIEAVGELLVIDVKEHASTALVTRSLERARHRRPGGDARRRARRELAPPSSAFSRAGLPARAPLRPAPGHGRAAPA